MRDHVLLQAIARVNRPYVDSEGVQKPVGLVVDFIGVLRELKKSLQFDSHDVSGVIEDLDVLLADFKVKIAQAESVYLKHLDGGDADERLERAVYGQFLELAARKAFYESTSTWRASGKFSLRLPSCGSTLSLSSGWPSSMQLCGTRMQKK